MSTPTFAILHATHGRPEKAIAAMRRCLENAVNTEAIEYIFAVNSDDQASRMAIDIYNNLRASLKIKMRGPSFTVIDDFSGSVEAWNRAAGMTRGALIIQMQDDLELPLGWDSALIDRLLTKVGLSWPQVPIVVAVSDGYRKDKLLCTAICNRKRYEQQGEFLHAGYQSVFSDDEFTIRAYADSLDGKCLLVEARDIVFRHEHAYHNPKVPMDDTYRRENSAEAYAIGSTLFRRRNQALLDRGLKTW